MNLKYINIGNSSLFCEKLFILMSTFCNFVENGQCEYASAKRVRNNLRLHKNFSSFVNENRMMDFEGDLSDR